MLPTKHDDPLAAYFSSTTSAEELKNYMGDREREIKAVEVTITRQTDEGAREARRMNSRFFPTSIAQKNRCKRKELKERKARNARLRRIKRYAGSRILVLRKIKKVSLIADKARQEQMYALLSLSAQVK